MAVSESDAEYLRDLDTSYETVPPAGRRKPDPDEPFRYVCPECRGQAQGNGRNYRCSRKGCRVVLEKDDLVDLKDGGDDG